MENKKIFAKKIKLNSLEIGNQLPLTLIAGPCIMESKNHLWQVARFLKNLTSQLNIQMIFKCSYDKANRSSQTSYRGFGIDEGLSLLAQIKDHFSFPILTDVHLPEQAKKAAKVADILQIPAFLCRQTDLIKACAQTGKIVNVKKGQFIAPWEMENIIEKIESFGNHKILLTERGTFFGYNNLVVDMRGLEIMKQTGFPVVFDATHSVQLPGGNKKSSSGQREFAGILARAAAGIGVAAIFMEVHPDPDHALSDGPNSVKLTHLKKLLQPIIAIDQCIKKINRI